MQETIYIRVKPKELKNYGYLIDQERHLPEGIHTISRNIEVNDSELIIKISKEDKAKEKLNNIIL